MTILCRLQRSEEHTFKYEQQQQQQQGRRDVYRQPKQTLSVRHIRNTTAPRVVRFKWNSRLLSDHGTPFTGYIEDKRDIVHRHAFQTAQGPARAELLSLAPAEP